METHITSTPFGRRALSAAMLAGQKAASQCRPDDKADKWKLFRAVCEARPILGATDRALAVLGALLSFYPDAELSGEGGLVVFPSNQQLSLRAHGMAPATLRRHLAVLVECGLVVRRDSPNGKRFARKGREGDIEQAYGFDLSPLLARAAEFEHLAEEVRAERKALHLVREQITLCRRDIAKTITFGLEEGIGADWQALHGQFRTIVGRIPRTATLLELQPVERELGKLAEEIRKVLDSHMKTKDPSGNESHNERHIQNSKTHASFEFEPRSEKEQGGAAGPNKEPAQPAVRQKTVIPPTGYPLGLILRACPDIADYARNGLTGWDDLIETANLVRGILGVSPDAWDQACEVMGRANAAVAVAAILQRSGQISSAGGYLRALTEKARVGEFSVGPVLMALLRARSRAAEANTG